MSVGLKRRSFLVVVLTLSVAAFAKPAHLLYHTGKGIAYPVRHPAKTAHGLWKIAKAVF